MCRKILITLVGVALATSVVMASTGSKTILVEGAPIHGANGLYFNSGDTLYIASAAGREIVVMNPETGEILDRWGPEAGVESPDDVTVRADGSIYYTAIFTGEVGRLSPEGIKIDSQFVAPGVNPITFSDDGRLFVALDFLGDALYELDPEFVSDPVCLADSLGMMNGMDWGPDDLLYGPIFTQSRIVRVDVDTVPVTIEEVATGLGVPAAVKFNSLGELYTVDLLLGQVIRVDTQTGDLEVIAQMAPGLDNLAFDSEDRLFVNDSQDGSVFEVFPDGTFRTVSSGGMILPGGVAVLPRGESESIYVADLWTLREFDGLTGESLSAVHHLFLPGGITSPMTVSPDGDNLVLSSWFNSEVQVWNPESNVVLEDYTDFGVPLNAIRFQEDLIVCEVTTGSIIRQDAISAERDTIASGFYVPCGLAATDEDLWAGDWATGIVYQIVDDGVVLSDPIPVATGLMGPEGLAVDLNGGLVVVETWIGRLSHINPETGEVSAIVDGLELGLPSVDGYPPTWAFNGVAVGSEGVIYVTGDIANVLYRIVVVNEADGAGYWKHQVSANLSGKGHTDYTASELLNFSQEIFDYFYLNEIEPIEVEGVTYVDEIATPLDLEDLLSTLSSSNNDKSMYAKACRHFLAMLLNVVSDKLGLYFQASEDGASTAQAIVYIDELLESGSAEDHAMAKDIAETLNEGGVVGEGVVPLTTPHVIFSEGMKKIIQPAFFSVSSPAPNPFNPTTTIGFALPEQSNVKLQVYDMSGRLVITAVDGNRVAGYHEVTIDGSDLASGVYFYQIEAGAFTGSGKMVLMK